MIMKNPIIVFANQKGGVGKSTLCMSFANYITKEKNIQDVTVIDTDPQKTIIMKRKTDIDKYSKSYAPYKVMSFSLDDVDAVENMMSTIKEVGNPFLFDTPGMMKLQGLLVLLAFCDYIICPTHFDNLSISATSEFLIYIEKLRASMLKMNGREMKAKLIIVPNLYDASVGTKEEKERWLEVRKIFSNYGVFAPNIPRRAHLEQRVGTFGFFDKQLEFCKESMDFLYNLIFENNE